MGIATSLLFFTAAATQPGAGEARTTPVPSAAISVQAKATTRIVAGAEVRFGQEAQVAVRSSKVQPQIRRDSIDILWIEFS